MNSAPLSEQKAVGSSCSIIVRYGAVVRLTAGAALLAWTTACTTPAVNTQPAEELTRATEVFTLQEGDVLQIAFANSPNLDVTQTIRRDGKITMAMVGEVTALGLTPSALEQELRRLYESQLVSNEITVVVAASSYEVYVSGAVLRPGKVMATRPLSALEAIMEAGGFDRAKADMTAVRVIREENGQMKNYQLNLKLVLEGRAAQPFYLRKYDIIDVPEKFSWF